MLPDRLARFRREAHVLAALNHPHIAAHPRPRGQRRGTTGARDGAGRWRHAREVIDSAVDVARHTENKLTDAPTPCHRPQIVDAIEAAHAQGIIHRDLKPANVKVRADGAVKVLDFGLAKALESRLRVERFGGASRRSRELTNDHVTGDDRARHDSGDSRLHVARQAKGRPVDKRADIWAFGCVLYEMLTGARAFAGDDVSDTLANILKSEPDWTAVPSGRPPRSAGCCGAVWQSL